jgi:hypothetical protein
MHTFKKLPTILPNTKNTTDQKWKGTAAQNDGSNMDGMGGLCRLVSIFIVFYHYTQRRPTQKVAVS